MYPWSSGSLTTTLRQRFLLPHGTQTRRLWADGMLMWRNHPTLPSTRASSSLTAQKNNCVAETHCCCCCYVVVGVMHWKRRSASHSGICYVPWEQMTAFLSTRWQSAGLGCTSEAKSHNEHHRPLITSSATWFVSPHKDMTAPSASVCEKGRKYKVKGGGSARLITAERNGRKITKTVGQVGCKKTSVLNFKEKNAIVTLHCHPWDIFNRFTATKKNIYNCVMKS